MSAPARLALYGAGLAVLFVLAFVIAGAVVPRSVVDDWSGRTNPHTSTTHMTHDGSGS